MLIDATVTSHAEDLVPAEQAESGETNRRVLSHILDHTRSLANRVVQFIPEDTRGRRGFTVGTSATLEKQGARIGFIFSGVE